MTGQERISSLGELEAFSLNFLEKLSSIQTDGATTLLLEGNLGSGKTAFTKCLAKALGVTEEVTSPTFILEKIYPTKNKRFKKLVHIDAYRFEKEEEAKVLELSNWYNDASALIVIEWPEKMKSFLPKTFQKLSFEFIDEGVRQITIHG